MKVEKMKELRSVIGMSILELEKIYYHDNDGSYLAVDKHKLFDIISVTIGSQPVLKFRTGLHKALDIVEEELSIEPRTCDILGQQMTEEDFK